MQVQMSVDIEAPPESVWPYLVEPEKAMEWYTMLKKFEYTNGEGGPDSTFYWEEDVRGKIYSNHFKTTEGVENRDRPNVTQSENGPRPFHASNLVGLFVPKPREPGTLRGRQARRRRSTPVDRT